MKPEGGGRTPARSAQPRHGDGRAKQDRDLADRDPEDACDEAYATDGYEQSIQNLRRNSLGGDVVFGDDGGAHQLGTASGDATNGYALSLRVPVSA